MDEFNLIQPKCVKLCMEFVTSRLNLILGEYFGKGGSGRFGEIKLVSYNYLGLGMNEGDSCDMEGHLIDGDNVILFVQNSSFALITAHANQST